MTAWSRRVARALGLAVCVPSVVGIAAAHDVAGSRFAAPVPLPLVLAGGATTVLATAAWVTRSGGLSPRQRDPVSLPVGAGRAVRATARIAFLLAFSTVVLAGLLGRQVAAENLATTFVWPVWFRGLGMLAVLVGSLWPTLSPWRTLYDGLCALEGGRIAVLGSYPEWLARWPAVVGFAAGLGALATLTTVPRSPRLTAGVLAGYAAVMLLGGVCLGPTWFRRADALAVLYATLGRVAVLPVERSDRGTAIRLRAPWTGCLAPAVDLSAAAFVVVAVYTVSFDGTAGTPAFQTLLFGVRDATGLGPGVGVLLYFAGLGCFLAGFAATAALAERVADHGGSWRDATLAFAPTVVPIAAGYEVAHNYPYVIANLGRVAMLALGHLGVAVDPIHPLGWLPLSAYWASQVALVVAGHVVAVVAAHGVARRRYPTPAAARRGHAPLLALMVGYTALSLWIVSRPVVALG